MYVSAMLDIMKAHWNILVVFYVVISFAVNSYLFLG